MGDRGVAHRSGHHHRRSRSRGGLKVTRKDSVSRHSGREQQESGSDGVLIGRRIEVEFREGWYTGEVVSYDRGSGNFDTYFSDGETYTFRVRGDRLSADNGSFPFKWASSEDLPKVDLHRASAQYGARDQSTKLPNSAYGYAEPLQGGIDDRYDGGAATDEDNLASSDPDFEQTVKAEKSSPSNGGLDSGDLKSKKIASRRSRSRSQKRSDRALQDGVSLPDAKPSLTATPADQPVKRKRGRPRKTDAQKAADKAQREKAKAEAKAAEASEIAAGLKKQQSGQQASKEPGSKRLAVDTLPAAPPKLGTQPIPEAVLVPAEAAKSLPETGKDDMDAKRNGAILAAVKETAQPQSPQTKNNTAPAAASHKQTVTQAPQGVPSRTAEAPKASTAAEPILSIDSQHKAQPGIAESAEAPLQDLTHKAAEVAQNNAKPSVEINGEAKQAEISPATLPQNKSATTASEIALVQPTISAGPQLATADPSVEKLPSREESHNLPTQERSLQPAVEDTEMADLPNTAAAQNLDEGSKAVESVKPADLDSQGASQSQSATPLMDSGTADKLQGGGEAVGRPVQEEPVNQDAAQEEPAPMIEQDSKQMEAQEGAQQSVAKTSKLDSESDEDFVKPRRPKKKAEKADATARQEAERNAICEAALKDLLEEGPPQAQSQKSAQGGSAADIAVQKAEEGKRVAGMSVMDRAKLVLARAKQDGPDSDSELTGQKRKSEAVTHAPKSLLRKRLKKAVPDETPTDVQPAPGKEQLPSAAKAASLQAEGQSTKKTVGRPKKKQGSKDDGGKPTPKKSIPVVKQAMKKPSLAKKSPPKTSPTVPAGASPKTEVPPSVAPTPGSQPAETAVQSPPGAAVSPTKPSNGAAAVTSPSNAASKPRKGSGFLASLMGGERKGSKVTTIGASTSLELLPLPALEQVQPASPNLESPGSSTGNPQKQQKSAEEMQAEVICEKLDLQLRELTKARDSITQATTTALIAAGVGASARVIRLIADTMEKTQDGQHRIALLYLTDSILQRCTNKKFPGCGPDSMAATTFPRVISAALNRLVKAVCSTAEGLEKVQKVLSLWGTRNLLSQNLVKMEMDKIELLREALPPSLPPQPVPPPAQKPPQDGRAPSSGRSRMPPSAAPPSHQQAPPKRPGNVVHLNLNLDEASEAAVLENQYGTQHTLIPGMGDLMRKEDGDSDSDSDEEPLHPLAGAPALEPWQSSHAPAGKPYGGAASRTDFDRATSLPQQLSPHVHLPEGQAYDTSPLAGRAYPPGFSPDNDFQDVPAAAAVYGTRPISIQINRRPGLAADPYHAVQGMQDDAGMRSRGHLPPSLGRQGAALPHLGRTPAAAYSFQRDDPFIQDPYRSSSGDSRMHSAGFAYGMESIERPQNPHHERHRPWSSREDVFDAPPLPEDDAEAPPLPEEDAPPLPGDMPPPPPPPSDLPPLPASSVPYSYGSTPRDYKGMALPPPRLGPMPRHPQYRQSSYQ